MAELRRALAAFGLAVAVAVAGCGGGGKGTIRIGLLSDCVSFLGSFNDLALTGAELPLLERGARLSGPKPSDGVEDARVAGKRVEILSGCTDIGVYTTLIQEARRLVEKEHVDVVIGPAGQTDGLILREIARRHPEVAFVLGQSLTQETTLHDPASNLFRFAPDGAQWAAGLGSYAYLELGWRTAVTVADDEPYVWPQVAGFVAEFCALGGRVVDRLWAPEPFADLTPLAASVPREVDGVALMPFTFQDWSGFVKAYAKREPDLARRLVLGPTAFLDVSLLARNGRLVPGVVTALDAPFESKNPVWLAYLRGLRKYFPAFAGPPSPAAISLPIPYHDAMEAVLEALEQVDGDLSHGERPFMRALAGLRLESPTGPIQLDANRQAIAPGYLSRVGTDARGKPVLRTIRVLPDVEQTFNGYFTSMTPPPTRTSPACRRGNPPLWATAAGR